MKNKPCIICKNKLDLLVLIEHRNFCIIKCRNCGLIYQDYPEKQNQKSNIYNSLYSDSPHQDFISHRFDTIVRKQIYNDIEKIHKSPGLMLDIGCSFGQTMVFFNNKGWRTIGIDVCKVSIKWAKAHGLNCLLTSIKDYNPAQKFDVIIMSHVLEHLDNPIAALKRIKKWLKPDGIIHIRVPNIESKLLRYNIFFLGELKPYEHLYYFSAGTINLLLEKIGLKCSVTTRYKHGIGSIINMIIRSKLVLRSSWHELNYQTISERKNFYLKAKNFYEKVLALADLCTFGSHDREIVAIAGNLYKKDTILL